MRNWGRIQLPRTGAHDAAPSLCRDDRMRRSPPGPDRSGGGCGGTVGQSGRRRVARHGATLFAHLDRRRRSDARGEVHLSPHPGTDELRPDPGPPRQRGERSPLQQGRRRPSAAARCGRHHGRQGPTRRPAQGDVPVLRVGVRAPGRLEAQRADPAVRAESLLPRSRDSDHRGRLGRSLQPGSELPASEWAAAAHGAAPHVAETGRPSMAVIICLATTIGMRTISRLFPLLLLAGCRQGSAANVTSDARHTDMQAAGKRAIVYTTAESTSFRLTPTDTVVFKPSEPTSEAKVYVFVDPRKTFQSFLGIGGALTDAAAETFAKLPATRQDELMTAYYSTDRGIGYTLARTNINSCDFSSASYTYVTEGDKDLSTFSIAPDLRYKGPLIKRAMAASGNQLKLFASPWSPPAYMKDNNDMLHGGHLRPEYAHAWALYFAKFVASYRKEGVPVWGITIQNEPMATQKWESCVFQAADERDFLKHHLGPVMAQQGLLGNVNIIVWDHNRDLIIQRALAIFDDSAATKYAWRSE